uniref:Uncharacterized protein n=1 Tax=Peronospora matthiolae TaxID=2874970 RepID=A0AAV1UX90_9STRA
MTHHVPLQQLVLQEELQQKQKKHNLSQEAGNNQEQLL